MNPQSFISEIQRDAIALREKVSSRESEAQNLIEKYIADNESDTHWTRELRKEQARILLELKEKRDNANYKDLLSTFDSLSNLIAKYDKKDEGPVAPQVTQFFFMRPGESIHSQQVIPAQLSAPVTDIYDTADADNTHN